jgi:geranylgeranyl pyrophosphate synthase
MSHISKTDLEDLKQWLINTWFQNLENSAYNDDLLAVVLQIWPDQVNGTPDSKGYTFLNLPTLCYHSLDETSKAILPVNLSWVLLYAAFYLLDKVEDQETEHALISKYGEGPVTNLTTGLILKAGEILSVARQAAAEADRIQEIQMDFYRLAAVVCAGQHLDLTVKEPDLDTAWKIAFGKSGNFFSLGCRIGARLGATSAEQVEAFSRYGLHLGTLIQIANDFAGLFPNTNGKSDIITGKYSLPIAYSFQVLPNQIKKVLNELLSTSIADPQAVQQALNIIIQSGALVYLNFEAEKHKTLAKSELEPIALNPELKDLLLSIPEKIIKGLQPS